MTLRELFEQITFSGCVTIHMVERGVEYQTCEGYDEITERNCDGNLPDTFLPYASNEVGEIYPSHAFFRKAKPDGDGYYRAEYVDSISIQVFATPSDDICEFYNTGGNCYCGWCKVDGGWFMGGESSWGGIWKTYSQALEAMPDEDCGYVRDVNDYDELKGIWERIYTRVINSGGYESEYCRKLLNTLDETLANDCDVKRTEGKR